MDSVDPRAMRATLDERGVRPSAVSAHAQLMRPWAAIVSQLRRVAFRGVLSVVCGTEEEAGRSLANLRPLLATAAESPAADSA